MVFRNHRNLDGQHAFLSASKYSWINYSDDKLIEVYHNNEAVKLGTELHQLAALAIKLQQRFPKSNKTICRYVNDAIGFRMTPEQVLYYSDNCFGTADAICFRDNMLRIHDLKTGKTPASMNQLKIYAALFCLEYHYKPHDIDTELRIYQNDKVLAHSPEPSDIVELMDKIQSFDKIITNMKLEEL